MRNLALVFMAVGLWGCGTLTISESDKQLNAQNRAAGELIEKKAADPEIKQAGADVKLNATQLATVIGEPQEKKEYSPVVSGESRKQSKEDHSPLGKYGLLALFISVLTQVAKVGLPKLLPLASKFLPTPFGTVVGSVLDIVNKSNVLFAPALGMAAGGEEGALVGLATGGLWKLLKDFGLFSWVEGTVNKLLKKPTV